MTWFLVSCQVPKEASLQEQVLSLGEIRAFNRGARQVIAAPHGEFDTHSAEVVERFCELVSWNCLVVRGYRTSERPINVNRPTEGLRLKTEKFSSDAAQVYSAYERNVDALFGRSGELYVEIHGNVRRASQGHIDIAHVGWDQSSLARLREILERHLEEQGLTEYQILLEGDPGFFYGASSCKKFGILSKMPRALHIETPIALRSKRRESLVKFLAGALSEVATMR